MPAFVWGEEFYTGIGFVDEQHHALIDLFNQLSASFTDRGAQGDVTVQHVFEQLMSYARQHFSHEEELMRRDGVDARHLAMHVRLHDDFTEQVQAIWSARKSLGNPAEIFLAFLTSWLCLHVLGVDQSLARQLAAIKTGVPAEDAYDQEQLRPKDKSSAAMIKALRNTYQTVSRLSLELISANRFLEERVIARTRDLQEANEALRLANQKLEVYSHTDGLLGIANRKYFDTRLISEWRRAVREQYSVGLLMIDVDFFKNYNDHYGHVAGDACLQAVARTAGSSMARGTDQLARYGGEEFVALLPNTSVRGAFKLAERIRQAVCDLNIPHADSAVAGHVTVSVGAASILPDRYSKPEQIVLAADEALYAAKQQGRNRVCLV